MSFYRTRSLAFFLCSLVTISLGGCQKSSVDTQIVSICEILENAPDFDGKKVLFNATAIHIDWNSIALAHNKCIRGPSTLALILKNEADQTLFTQSRALSDSKLLIGVFGEFTGTIVIPKSDALHIPTVAMEVELIENPQFRPATDQYESLLDDPPPALE